MAFFF
ncbi:hemolysin transporter protein shlB, partial [Yersinia pestis PY-100]